jgi:secreted PhoX family phosphatase
MVGYGPLRPPDGNGLRLPAGFTSRVIATSGEPVADTGYRWHQNPDGGATFATPDGGWIYVSNDESDSGGVSAVEFTAAGTIVRARSLVRNTRRNCAGGPTPWGTWLSCEEIVDGQVWECDPAGRATAVVRPGLGRFRHEAAAVDPVGSAVYLTEDQPDGALYRFVPDTASDLSAGRLEVLVDRGGLLSWAEVPDPDALDPATRDQVEGTRRFDGGEGAWFNDGVLWFTTKGDHRVWSYVPATNTLTVEYDAATAAEASLTGVDNVTVAEPTGDVFVAEEDGNLEVCVLVPDGAIPFLRLVGVDGSELTGPAFSPDATRLYVSSQRNPGRTYEITGPFHGSAGA